MRFILLFFIYFLGFGSYLSSLSPYIHTAYGEDAWLVFFMGQVFYPLGYFLAGYFSDRFRSLRRFLIFALLVLAPLQFFFFSFQDSLSLSMILSALTRLFHAICLQLMTIATLEGAGTDHFGRIRKFGTIGFLLVQGSFYLLEIWAWFGVPTGGLAGPGGMLPAGELGAVFYLLAILPAFLIPSERRSSDKYYFHDALVIFRQWRLVFFLGLSFFFYFNFQLVDYYIGQFLKERGGMAAVYGGWCLAVLLEIPFLHICARMVQNRPLRLLFLISIGAGALRFGWLSLEIAGYNFPSAVYSQILHGIHFGGYYMGAIYTLRYTFPEHLFGTANGIYTIFAPALGGISGNYVYGQLLYAEQGVQVAAGTGLESFLPLFFYAMLLQGILFFGFIFLPSPVKRTS